MPKRLRNNHGSALLMAVLVMLMLTLIFAAAVNTSITDIDIARNAKDRTSAFYIAEAGLEFALGVLRDTPSELDNDTLVSLTDASYALGNGSFSLEVDGATPYWAVTSHGSSSGGKASVEVAIKRRRNAYNVWNNVVCGGTGRNKQLMNGNASLHGSVHICGDSLTQLDPAFTISGSGGIFNNYSGMEAALSSRLPALDTITFNGEVVRTLNAELRAERGRIDLDGTGTVGNPDAPGGSPPVKETMDGCYVEDGFGGNSGEGNVFSDNGTTEGYDLEVELDFPDLNDPYTDPNTGIMYATYLSYLRNNALVISGDLTLMPGVSLSPMSNGFGSISMDANGNLQISGIVYVTGKITVQEDIAGDNDGLPLLFDGKGTLVSQGNTLIDTDILSKGTFPTDDVLGFISAQDLQISRSGGETHLNVMGAFFAQGQISNYKQNQVAGALVANYMEIYNVPDLFHVPSIAENLPPGMPGHEVSAYTYEMVNGTWRELW